MNDTLSAETEFEAVEELHRMGCTDGLPVIVPTARRVGAMVLASGADPDAALGTMGPLHGVCTVEKLATAAVMAGCLPDHMPIVFAATKAVIEPEFDLTEMQSTTFGTAPLIIVNGPARHLCGVTSGFGALGPGHRANASIGRALRLAMINIGGARPGSSDMTLLGHGGKFGQCMAEDEEHSPFTPLHVSRGFSLDQSVVTVIGTEAPHSVAHQADADDPTSPTRLLDGLADSVCAHGTNNAWLGWGQAVVAITPEQTAELATAGYDRTSICEHIVGRAHTRDGRRSFRTPDDVLLVAAGGAGLYSFTFPTWCAGAHRNRAVSVEVDVGQACEVPWK
ncbi:MAG: hypothetical protein ACKVIY_08635 [Acidimicrobiales bacterium]